ncbi:CPBP family intramembrane glutamic endopeptidase [Philodulcilactobacillus myokoensis]|uniref:CPBP family intramembrane glutamic endopeptidase n=1 Tax=Philodulcilactobacillus myokoensis TaxID=2929573 RepID=UPI00256FC15D|nr:CPBP family intramembrane glutamic endopeptidase [Philodulcilactobacillus myokoensis]
MSDLSQPLADSICFSIGPGIFEEYVFRGVIFKAFLNKFKKNYKGILISILFSSFLFGLIHSLNIINSQNISSTSFQALNALIFGIVMSTVYLRTRNIIFPILSHIIYDFLAGVTYTTIDSNSTGVIVFYIFLIIFAAFMIRPKVIKSYLT